MKKIAKCKCGGLDFETELNIYSVYKLIDGVLFYQSDEGIGKIEKLTCQNCEDTYCWDDFNHED